MPTTAPQSRDPLAASLQALHDVAHDVPRQAPFVVETLQRKEAALVTMIAAIPRLAREVLEALALDAADPEFALAIDDLRISVALMREPLDAHLDEVVDGVDRWCERVVRPAVRYLTKLGCALYRVNLALDA